MYHFRCYSDYIFRKEKQYNDESIFKCMIQRHSLAKDMCNYSNKNSHIIHEYVIRIDANISYLDDMIYDDVK